MCRCKPPFHGNGKLGCFRPDDAVAVLLLDPNLMTFNGDYLNMATPCRYKVIHYSIASPDDTRASAEVYAKNDLTAEGDYYVKNVLIAISVMTETKTGKHTILLEGNATGGNYTFVTTEMENSLVQSSQHHLDLRQFFISVTVDEINNFIIARVDGVGLTVRFRPTPIGTGDVQQMLPGVTMVIDKEVLESVQFVNGTLSSSPKGVSVSAQAKLLGVDLQLYTYFLAILNTPAIIMDDRQCLNTTLTFTNVCKHDKPRLRLLQTCSSLYSDKPFLRCIHSKRKDNRNNSTGHRLLFRYCVQAFCENACPAWAKLTEATQCPLPAVLRDFQCSKENLLVH